MRLSPRPPPPQRTISRMSSNRGMSPTQCSSIDSGSMARNATLSRSCRIVPDQENPYASPLLRANKGAIKEAKRKKKPKDRWNLIYWTLVLLGVGAMMPWNVIITAKEYFVHYKLSVGYTQTVNVLPYSTYFLPYICFAAQVPNVMFNWINVFLKVDANLTFRIVWTLVVEVLVFILIIVTAMVDTSACPQLFFYLTIASVIILNGKLVF